MPASRLPALGLAFAAILGGCGGSGGSGGSNTPATGTLSLGLTDAPIDEVFEVNVQVRGVSIKPQGGPALDFDFDMPVDFDLLALRDGSVATLLDGETVPAGAYNWIELHTNAELDSVFDSYVRETESGGMIELRTPSGSVRFVSGFVVTAGRNNAFTLDWDVRRALTNPQGVDGWHLTPAHRLIDMTEYGELHGTVADALTMDDHCTSDADGGNVVYVYPGHDVTPDDLGGADEPLTSAPVAVDGSQAGAYAYSIAFLDPGPYTVAFTCQGLDDDPEVDQAVVQVRFSGAVNADVAAGRDTSNEAPTID